MRMIFALTTDLNWHLSDLDGSMLYTLNFQILDGELPIVTTNIAG